MFWSSKQMLWTVVLISVGLNGLIRQVKADAYLECTTEFMVGAEAFCDWDTTIVGCNCVGSDSESFGRTDYGSNSCQCDPSTTYISMARCCRLRNTHAELKCQVYESSRCKMHKEQVTSCISPYDVFYVKGSPQTCVTPHNEFFDAVCCHIEDPTDSYELECISPDSSSNRLFCPAPYQITSCSCDNTTDPGQMMMHENQCLCETLSGIARCCRLKKTQNRHHG